MEKIVTGDHGSVKKIGEVPNIQELIEEMQPYIELLTKRIHFRAHQPLNPRKSLHVGLRYSGINEGVNLTWDRGASRTRVTGTAQAGDLLIANFETPGICRAIKPDQLSRGDWYLGTALEDKDTEGVASVASEDLTAKSGLVEEDFVDWASGTEVLQDIWSKINIQPYGRVRLMGMPPWHNFGYHIDKGVYCTMHIPLITNPYAFMVSDGQLWKFPVGGIYVINATVPHTAMNAGTTLRTHIITNIATDYFI